MPETFTEADFADTEKKQPLVFTEADFAPTPLTFTEADFEESPKAFTPPLLEPFKTSGEVKLAGPPPPATTKVEPDAYIGHREKANRLIDANTRFHRGIGSREELQSAYGEFRAQQLKEGQQRLTQEAVKAGEASDAFKGVPALWQLLNTPTIEAKPPEEYVKQVEKSGTLLEKRSLGIREGLDEFLSSMTTPLSVGTLGAAGIMKGAPALARGLSLLFGWQTGEHLATDVAEQMGEELAKPKDQRDERKVASLWTSVATGVPFTAMMGAHAALGEKAPLITRPITGERATAPAEIPTGNQRPVAPPPETGPPELTTDSPMVFLNRENQRVVIDVMMKKTAGEELSLAEKSLVSINETIQWKLFRGERPTGEEIDMLRGLSKPIKTTQETPQESKAPNPELQADIARRKAIWEEIKKMDPEDPKFTELWGEAETIKNKYGGYVPKEEAAAATETQGTETPQEAAKVSVPLSTSQPQSQTSPKAKSQMIRELSEAIGTPIRFGRLVRRVAGYFMPRANLIGSKRANDIPVVSHEVGHRLDQMFNLSSDPNLKAELLHLGDNARPGSMSSWTPSKPVSYRLREGLAEYVRYWLIDPQQVSQIAPRLDVAFKNTLSSNKKLETVLHQTREDIRNWRIAEPQARLMSNVSVGDNPAKTRYTLSDLTRDVLDDLHYLKLTVDDVSKLGSQGLEPSKNPYILARLLRGAYGVADTFINNGPVDFTTRKVSMGNGLKQVLEPVGNRLSDFRAYIISRQAKEMQKQGKATGLEDSDIDFVYNKYRNDPQFNGAFDKLKQWSDSFIQYSVDAGYLSPESAAAMRKMNQEYVPMHRIFEVGAGEFGQPTGGTGRGLNAVGQSFKGRKGSQRDIVDPLETYVKNAYTIIQNAEKNAVNIALADLADEPGMGKLVEKIATPKQAEKVSLEKLRKELENAGADLANVPDDLLLTFWKDSNFAPRGENIIRVNRGGKPEFYRLSPELFKTMAALDHESAGILAKILSAPAQVLRAGVTLTPDFALANAMRDTLASSVVSRHGVFPFQHTLRGLYALVRDPKTVAEWKSSGASQSVEAHYFDRDKVQKFIQSQIGKDFSYTDYAKFIGKFPLTAMRILSGALEHATRIGEYQQVYNRLIKRGYSEGEARRLAAFESRDLQDFAMGGAKTKALRRATAFWNAAMQGNYRLYQNLKDPATRWQTMAKGFAWVTVPSITLFLLNKDNEDYWDRPQWERDLFWLIPRGKDEFGHTQFLRVPKPFEIGLIFGTVPERIMAGWQKQNPKAFDGLAQQFANSFVANPVPQSLVTVAETSAGPEGYSWFRHQPIVPKSLEGLPPELQFTDQNSLTAKRIGRALNVSPMKVDHAVSGLFGTLGKQATHQGVDRALSWMTGESRTARETYPGARFIATPAGTQSQAVENFYDELGKLRQEKKAERITPEQEDRLIDLEVVAKELSALRREQKEAKTDGERQEIGLKMREAVKLLGQ